LAAKVMVGFAVVTVVVRPSTSTTWCDTSPARESPGEATSNPCHKPDIWDISLATTSDGNPFAFYSDVVNNPAEADNMVPADPYLLQDIENNNLANFTWITPHLIHDAHNGSSDQQALEAAASSSPSMKVS
jgi:hypothetical protein